MNFDHEEPNVLRLSPAMMSIYMDEWLQAKKPHVHMLFKAAWKLGMTVNGVRPPRPVHNAPETD